MGNRYGTLTEKWKVDLVKKLARKDGFRGDELDDVLQDIVPIIIGFKFEPEKSNGATEATVIEAVVRKRLKFMLRCRARRQKHENIYRMLHGATEEGPAPEESVPGPDRLTGMAIDVQKTVADFTPQEQAVCVALADGQTRCEVAEGIGISRYEVDQIIGRIAEQFRGRDLDAWLWN